MDEDHLNRDCVAVLAFFQVVPTFTMYAAALPHVAHLKTKTSQPSFFMSDELKLVRLHNLRPTPLHYFIDFNSIVGHFNKAGNFLNSTRAEPESRLNIKSRFKGDQVLAASILLQTYHKRLTRTTHSYLSSSREAVLPRSRSRFDAPRPFTKRPTRKTDSATA